MKGPQLLSEDEMIDPLLVPAPFSLTSHQPLVCCAWIGGKQLLEDDMAHEMLYLAGSGNPVMEFIG